MNNKIVFFNTGWMDLYKGLSHDEITGGGKHVVSTHWGSEIFNFNPFNSNLYGYVQPKIDKKYNNPSIIKLEKLGASKVDERVDGVTVVWTAADPDNGGTYIVGWYKNATVFRHYQQPPINSRRRYKKNSLGYYTKTNTKNGKLLPIDERVVLVQRQKKNWMGQSNVWYAHNNPEFVEQLDPLKRIEVEKRAVLFVTKYYEYLGYQIQSFERDNVGWDLTATNSKTELKLEVKGLSGINIATELTHNELKNLKADKKFYRLCIVTNALSKPILKVFAYSKDNNHWASEDGTVIRFEEVKSARIYI